MRITPEWLIWYGMRVGLSYGEALDVPFGELLDYAAIEQIANGAADDATPDSRPYDEIVIPDLR